MKRTLSAILLALLLASNLAACGESQPNSDNGEVSTSDTTEATETTEAETDYLVDVLPEKDFDGYNFRMYIRDTEDYIKELYVEETNGDLMNDAVFERNSKVSEMYNVTFSTILSGTSYGDGADKAILANEDAYDLISAHGRTAFKYSDSKLVLDWNDLEYVDLEQPWWNQDARREFSFNGKLYIMVGDILYLDFGSANGMLFNKTLLKNYSLESPYDLVENDEWSFDKFTEMAKTSVLDLNGDSEINYLDDRMGYVTGRWIGPIQVLYSAGERIATVKDGKMELCVNTPGTINAFDKFFSLTTSEGMYVFESDDNVEITQPFLYGRALFNDMNIRNTILLRDMEDDFGIVPWPKLDESLEGYYANVDAGCSLLAVPITVENLECVSLVLEAMGCISYNDVIPLYYETVLTTKYARDEQSVAMLEIINSNRVFDIGYYHPNVGEINSIGRMMNMKKNYNFASYYASLESKTQANIDKINEVYAD